MRVSQDEKDRSHLRIIDAAARLARERGIDATSVADVMSAAGLTHGGFYRHFESKDAMLEAALDAALREVIGALESRLSAAVPEDAVKDFQSYYVSAEHVAHPGIGCPLAALGGDVGRGVNRLKAAFGVGVNRILDLLAKGMKGTSHARRESAIRRLAMMTGAVVLARGSDAETARQILEVCRR